MSTQISDSQQGELQGGLGSMASLTAIISPPFMTTLFAAFTSTGSSGLLPRGALAGGGHPHPAFLAVFHAGNRGARTCRGKSTG